MARIAEEEIARLKREVAVERLAAARGVELVRHGAELIGRCPFHDDHTPSLVISPQKNLWHCLGACRAGGTTIDWVMRAEGVSFRHAVELLREDRFPLAASAGGNPPQRTTVPRLPAPVSRDADDRALLLQVAHYYHEALKRAPEALRYLEARGLKSSEMVGHFELGFANRTLGYGLPQKNRQAGAEVRGRLQRLGIYRESGHEHFNGSVVIPIFDAAGQVVQMYGRKITPSLREGTPLHLYLPGPQQGVWNEPALAVSKEIILCEALIDALTFWCAGFRHVTASYGINGFTEQHRAALRKYGTKKVYIAYDRDEAGERAAEELAEELLGMGIECYRVQFPRGMDANDYALKVQPASRSLAVLLNKAEWLGKGRRVMTTAPAPAAPEKAPPPSAPPAANGEDGEATEPVARENPIPLAAASEPPEEPTATVAISSSAPPAIEVPVEIRGEEIIITQGERRYRIRGLGKNLSHELLKINLLVASTNRWGEAGFHVDTLDLYQARQRAVFIKQACEELGVKEEIIRRDLGRVLLKLEELQDEQIRRALEPQEKTVELTEDEKAAALDLLCDPRLLDRVLADFARCGMVGEETNKLMSYLAVTSRLLEAPLAILVQASSAAGKTALMEAVLDFLPEEQRVEYSAMTGQALFYMGETDLKHKVLAIVEEEGALRAAYALKLLQSEGVLTIASTGKDPASGRLVTHQYRVEGPVMIFLTTTAIDLDEELLNRCLVLTVDEDRAQTRAIHQQQREVQTLEGLLARQERDETLRIHRNAQRLLKPLFVANPYARQLTFLDRQTRTRRDHMKYLTLIRALALLHQYQRPRKTTSHRGKPVEYIEVTTGDIAVANRLAHEVLGRSLDELPPQTRRLLLLIDEMVTQACNEQRIERTEYRFSRKQVREHTAWSDSQLKKHLHRLEELEYLLVHHGGRGQSLVYELVFERRDDGRPLLPGLIDVEKLESCNYDENQSRSKEEKSPPGHRQVSGVSPTGLGDESPTLAARNGDSGLDREKLTVPAHSQNPAVILNVDAAAGARAAERR
jgi:DNA primase catalytic core